jgi:hypothetical protein
MYTVHSSPNSAAAVAVATPCWPAPGLGDHPRLADALGEQRLAEHVVDLVRAGVVEVLALQDDASPAGVRREARNLGDDRRPPRVAAAEFGEFGAEGGVELGEVVGLAELIEGGDEGFGHESPAEVAEVRTGLRSERHVTPPGKLRGLRWGRP